MALFISAAGSSGTADGSIGLSSLSYVNKHTLISESKVIINNNNNNNNNDINKQQYQQLQ